MVEIVSPLMVSKKTDLEFGFISASGAGTAVLEPNDNGLTTSGGVRSMGGNPTGATFSVVARSPTTFHIRIPTQPITLTREGGTETMTVDNWSLQGSSIRILLQPASFDFRVGGTLRVRARQAEGFYSGAFDVTVYYP